MTFDPYGWTIFCDDIRAEVGGKFSYMGIYRGTMFVHTDFPVSLPKLGIVIQCRISPDDLGAGDMNVGIFFPGDDSENPSVRAVLPVSKVSPIAEAQRPKPDAKISSVEISTHILLAPVIFKQSGRIKVRAEGPRGPIKLGTLRIERASALDAG
jgi:hypothetical protein